MNAIQVFSLVLLSVLAAHAHDHMQSKCRTAAVQENFDVNRYLGKWYEIQKLPNSFQRGQCSTATYSPKSPGVLCVHNKEKLPDGSPIEIYGTAMPSYHEPAKLQLIFSEKSPPAPYWVLCTDYDTYALVYGCTDRESQQDLAWILSRDVTLHEDIIHRLHGMLISIGIQVDNMLPTIQNRAYCCQDKAC